MKEWIAAQDACNACDEDDDSDVMKALWDVESKAHCACYETKPTTLAGVIAFASFLATDDRCDTGCANFKDAIASIAAALRVIESNRSGSKS